MQVRVFAVTAVSMLGTMCVEAQTVQLPTFHQFSVSTTVSVPDRGSTQLGGVRRSATGSNRFGTPGLPGNRSGGAGVQGGGATVSAQIHDFDAMDQDLRQQAACMRGADPQNQQRLPQEAHSDGAKSSAVPSLAEIRRRKAAQKPTDEEARSLIARGEEALAAGKLGTAKIYFQMAARRVTGPLRDRALAKYHQCLGDNRNTVSRAREGSVAKLE